MEWNTLFQLIHSCTDCNTSLITGIEQLSAHFQEHIFFSKQTIRRLHFIFSTDSGR